jgi:RsiW-degrading membrane proteinase PrsW (M82 family)
MENENTITEQQELETLRSQMDILRKKLEQESIINEKLMRETMRSRVSTINRQGWISIAAAICMVLWFPLCFNTLSTAFIITTIVFTAVDAIATWIIHKQVDERQLMSEDMRTVANKMKTLKKRYQWSTVIELPLVLAWCVWFCYEVIQMTGEPWQFMAGAVAFGALIGFFIALRMYRKVIDNCNAIIQQIEE